ncbi:MAG: hypothetical protein HQL09_08220 [Nitrospirae bacterium]|nr:hypothetical protein [Nitrospirota bacterium]
MSKHRMFLKVLLISTIILFAACASFAQNTTDGNGVVSVGIVKKQGITTYMYGTHVLMDDNGKTLYALKSDHINLDKYIDKKVTVKGDLTEGYPVDFGPNYLNVKSIE